MSCHTSKLNVEMVRKCVQAKYLKCGRTKAPLPGRSDSYIEDLGNDIKQNGLKIPVIIAINKKKTERAYIHEGNHRMAPLLDNDVNWVPLMMTFLFLSNVDDTHFCFVPRTINGNWPSNPKSSNFGFETKPIYIVADFSSQNLVLKRNSQSSFEILLYFDQSFHDHRSIVLQSICFSLCLQSFVLRRNFQLQSFYNPNSTYLPHLKVNIIDK